MVKSANNILRFMALVGIVFMRKSCSAVVEVCEQTMWPYMQFFKIAVCFPKSEFQVLFKCAN